MTTFSPEAFQYQSFLHRIDPRARILAIFAFAILVCLAEQFTVLLSGLSIAVALLLITHVAGAHTLHRFLGLNLFMLLLVATLPLFTPGMPFYQVGSLTWSREGLWRAAAITFKANTVMIIFTALLGTLEPAHLGLALRRLGFPNKLVHIFLFMVRYIDVVHREYHRLSNAIKLRGFQPGFNRHTFRTYGNLIALQLVRGLDRSDRIFAAMKCRGFQNRFYVLTPFKITHTDVLFTLIAAGSLLFLGWMEWR